MTALPRNGLHEVSGPEKSQNYCCANNTAGQTGAVLRMW